MDHAYVLFDPTGRIGPRDFWRGVILLVASQVIMQTALVYGPPILVVILSILSLALVYPYLCVFGKRLHDAGKSAWFFVLLLVGYLLIAQIAGQILQPFASEALVDAQQTLQQAAEDNIIQAMFETLQLIAKVQYLPGLVVMFLVNGVLGYFVARLPSEAGPNQYGPPVGA